MEEQQVGSKFLPLAFLGDLLLRGYYVYHLVDFLSSWATVLATRYHDLFQHFLCACLRSFGFVFRAASVFSFFLYIKIAESRYVLCFALLVHT